MPAECDQMTWRSTSAWRTKAEFELLKIAGELRRAHSMGSCYSPIMPKISVEESWMIDAENTVREILGELDDRMRVAVELGMVLALQGHREGLIELV